VPQGVFRSWSQNASGILPILVLSILAGCVPSVFPAPKRLFAPDGASLQIEPDASSLRVGDTTREEVRRAFAAVRVSEGDRLFIARWARSGLKDYVWQNRYWTGKNVLIAFDSNERVERFKVCLDRQLLEVEHLPSYLSSETNRADMASLQTRCVVRLDSVERLTRVVDYDGLGPSSGHPVPAFVRLNFALRPPSRPPDSCVTDFPTFLAIVMYLRDRPKG
jgi:hypothetical protein